MPEAARTISRRSFVVGSFAAGGTALLGISRFRSDTASPVEAAVVGSSGYGPLGVAGSELAVPAGFRYATLGIEGSMMADGRPTPTAHDGMAAFPLRNGNVFLVRNHEVRALPGQVTLIGAPEPSYDLTGGGGTTWMEVEAHGDRRLVGDGAGLSGTVANCAGGPTPWGTWLSCEETTEGVAAIEGGGGRERPHGYVFEVPATPVTSLVAQPLRAMGRFAHEAVAVDPATGIVYQTEDNGYDSGFYRFLPERPGDLGAGGTLQQLAVPAAPGYDTAFDQATGVVLPVSWVDIDDPDPEAADTDTSVVFNQGLAKGAARFKRLEGCGYGRRSVYFTATEGGDAGLGQVWEYRPDREELRLVFESGDVAVLDSPDNLVVSPRGGLVMCEDGSDEHYLRGMSSDGTIFDIARNIENQSEFAGACFSPDGETLFVNTLGGTGGPTPALAKTFAIWGPWGAGGL